MRKVTTLFLLFFTFILSTKGYTQTIDLRDFYIVSQSPLSDANKAQIDYLTEDFSTGIKADLQSKGYTLLTDAATSGLHSTELYGHQVNYRSSADQVVFGRVLYDDTGRLSFITYVCDVIQASGMTTLDPLRVHTASGSIGLWENKVERVASISATVNGLFKIESVDTFVFRETFFETPETPENEEEEEETFYEDRAGTMEASSNGFDVILNNYQIEVVDTPQLISTRIPGPSKKEKASRSDKLFVGNQ